MCLYDMSATGEGESGEGEALAGLGANEIRASCGVRMVPCVFVCD